MPSPADSSPRRRIAPICYIALILVWWLAPRPGAVRLAWQALWAGDMPRTAVPVEPAVPTAPATPSVEAPAPPPPPPPAPRRVARERRDLLSAALSSAEAPLGERMEVHVAPGRLSFRWTDIPTNNDRPYGWALVHVSPLDVAGRWRLLARLSTPGAEQSNTGVKIELKDGERQLPGSPFHISSQRASGELARVDWPAGTRLTAIACSVDAWRQGAPASGEMIVRDLTLEEVDPAH